MYTMEYPAYSATLLSTLRRKDFTSFNGFIELTKRDHWIDDLIALIDKYHSEEDDIMASRMIKFLSTNFVYTKMNLNQQKNLLQSIQNTLIDLSVNKPNGENLSQVRGIFYYAGLIVYSYYPSITGRRISSITPLCFEYNYEEAKEKIMKALQTAINRGELVEDQHEK